MKAEEKIYKVLERIKSKTDLAPVGSVIDYRAGWEINDLGAEEEILILNKLVEDGVIEVTQNFAYEKDLCSKKIRFGKFSRRSNKTVKKKTK